MEIGVVVGIIGAAVSVSTFIIGRMTASKSSGREDGQMLSDMGYIKSGIDTLRGEIKDFREILDKVRIEQAAQARDIKSAYERIEKLEKRMAHYHEGGNG